MTRCLTIAVVLLCAACAPVPQYRYVPDAADGKVVYAYCRLNSHVPVGVEVTREGVQTIVSLARNDGRDYVELQFDVPAGKTVVLQSNALELDRGDSQPAQESVFPNVSLVDTPIVNSQAPSMQSLMLPIGAPLVGATFGPGPSSPNKNFWLATYVDTLSAHDVWITLPAFTINGTPVRLDRFHMQRRLLVIIALINC
jgi:hypothetical protein